MFFRQLVYSLVWGASQPVTGMLSDIIGRKKLIVSGLWLLGLGIASVPLVNNITTWVIAAVIMGTGLACSIPTSSHP